MRRRVPAERPGTGAGRTAAGHGRGRADAPGRHRPARDARRGWPARDAGGDRHRPRPAPSPEWRLALYELPESLARKSWRGRYAGQTQKWLAYRFTGSDADIRLDTAHPEFSAWRWAPPETVPGPDRALQARRLCQRRRRVPSPMGLTMIVDGIGRGPRRSSAGGLARHRGDGDGRWRRDRDGWRLRLSGGRSGSGSSAEFPARAPLRAQARLASGADLRHDGRLTDRRALPAGSSSGQARRHALPTRQLGMGEATPFLHRRQVHHVLDIGERRCRQRHRIGGEARADRREHRVGDGELAEQERPSTGARRQSAQMVMIRSMSPSTDANSLPGGSKRAVKSMGRKVRRAESRCASRSIPHAPVPVPPDRPARGWDAPPPDIRRSPASPRCAGPHEQDRHLARR